jgi:hypothetical protein
MTSEDSTSSTIIADKYRGNYQAVKFAKGGKNYTSRISSDSVAYGLLGADDGELRDVLEENGAIGQIEGKTYPNQGMFRMAAGAILRGKLRRGESIKIKGKIVKTLDQQVKSPFID